MQELTAQLGNSLKARAGEFVKPWQAWADRVLEVPDDGVAADPEGHIDLIYAALHFGKAACVLDNGRATTDRQKALRKKCREWEFLAAETGYRSPGKP